ncbi:MAG: glutamine cyclotransferase [Bacteroidia bacterium]|nr:MAG: glutamine cyclotransferase [Bacteroidia bacterium]
MLKKSSLFILQKLKLSNLYWNAKSIKKTDTGKNHKYTHISRSIQQIAVFFLILSSFLLFLTECNSPKEEKNNLSQNITPQKPEKFWNTTPNFNADSCYYFVKQQVDLGPRVPGSKAHEKCVLWLKQFFESKQCKVELQKFVATTFDKKQWTGTNIIVKYNPNNNHRILLCAHYDTRPFADRDEVKNKNQAIPGANDGASGVAVLMSVIQSIQQLPLKNIGIDIVLFDLEDYGDAGGDSKTWCLGSQHWAKNLSPTSIKPVEGILLDMVGDTNAVFPKEGVSIQYHPTLVHSIWTIAQKAGYRKYFIDESTNEITDDHLFINVYTNIPTIDIVHYHPQKSDFFDHHHKITDDMKNISKQTLQAVGQTLLYYLYQQEEKLNHDNP